MFESMPVGSTVTVVHVGVHEVREATMPEVLAALAGMPLSAAALRHLDSIDLESLDAPDRVTALALWDRYRSWLDARVQVAMIAVAGPGPAGPGPARPGGADRPDDVGREEVACALGISSGSAATRLRVARELHARLSRTFNALSEGRISYWHAKSLVDAVAMHEGDVARRVESEMLDEAQASETLTGFRRRLERVVIAADPRSVDEQHEVALQSRRVVMWPEPHGMATVAATLTAAEAATTMAALTALAYGSRADGDDRPIDVLRADALGGLFAGWLADPGLPTAQRSRPRVGVTMDFATLAGLADHPGHLDGYGPIPPVLARRLAASGVWHRLVTDPVTGALLDYGTKVYRPPAELVEFLTARDRTCRFPTCTRQARLSDLDHAEPFDRSGQGTGGSTSAAGMGCLCRRDHGHKTSGATRLVSHPDGSATWTTASGHSYHRPAVDHCPEHTAHLGRLRAQAAVDEADAAEVDAEIADARWDEPAWVWAHAEDYDWVSHDDGTGPNDDDVRELVETADESAAMAHDATADEADRGDPDTDTSSGNDPPTF